MKRKKRNHHEVGRPSSHRPTSNGKFALERDSWGQLIFTHADGERVFGVRPVRLFPLTAPQKWISLVAPDGKELTLVKDPQHIPAETRALLFEELSSRDFLPVITKIHRISAGASPAEWFVDTDRGLTQFPVASDDDLRLVGTNTVLILDAYGTRFLVPDMDALDPVSRRWLLRQL